MTSPFDRLAQTLARLPGLGRRSAERAALALVRRDDGLVETLMDALREARENIRLCSQCGALTTVGQDPCRICSDVSRDAALLCVVEEPSDILALERSGGYHGRYHALLGKLSPSRISKPSELRLRELVRRVESEGITEIILAVSTDMEGDATASYIADLFRNSSVRLTRLAFGLPADSGVGYSDPLTLKRAIGGRQSL